MKLYCTGSGSDKIQLLEIHYWWSQVIELISSFNACHLCWWKKILLTRAIRDNYLPLTTCRLGGVGVFIKDLNHLHLRALRECFCNSVPAPTHLIQMNGSLSGFSRAWWWADYLNQVCWSSETSQTWRIRGRSNRIGKQRSKASQGQQFVCHITSVLFPSPDSLACPGPFF